MNHLESIGSLTGICSLLLVSAFLLTGTPVARADSGGVYSIYDADRDGFLDKAEFDKFAETKRNRPNVAEIWRFDNVDADGDNKISEQEMVNSLMEEVKRRKKE